VRENTLIVAVRSLSAPILAELSQLLGGVLPFSEGDTLEDAELHEDDEFIHSVWMEVGDDLRGAMRRYPVARAAADALEASSSAAA
jgi:hypothetical protein